MVTPDLGGRSGGMVHVQVSKLMLVAGLAAAGLVGVGGVAEAAPSSDAAAIECVNDGAASPSASLAAGSNEVVTAQALCVTAVCADGVLTTITDDSGVQHQACVASAAEPPAAASAPAAPATPDKSALGSSALSAPSTTTQAMLPATGAGTGGLVIAALLVGSGSVVSLLGRRRPSGVRKGFRGRGVTS